MFGVCKEYLRGVLKGEQACFTFLNTESAPIMGLVLEFFL